MILSVKTVTDFELPEEIEIIEFDDRNNAINVVPKYCSCIVSVKNEVKVKDAYNLVKNFASEYNFNIVTEIINNNELKITSHGTQAHAAHPDLGVNAISRLIIVLDKLFNNFTVFTESKFTISRKYAT